MTAELRDLRASISVQADQVLEALSIANNVTKQQLVRDVHKALLVERMTRGNGRQRSGPE